MKKELKIVEISGHYWIQGSSESTIIAKQAFVVLEQTISMLQKWPALPVEPCPYFITDHATAMLRPLRSKKKSEEQEPTPPLKPELRSIARAVAAFKRGEFNEDATAFREWVYTFYDEPEAEKAFTKVTTAREFRRRQDYHQEAVKYLKRAGCALKKRTFMKSGEGNMWDDFMDEVMDMKKRESRDKEEVEMLDEFDGFMERVKNGDEAMINAILEQASKEEEEEEANEVFYDAREKVEGK